jgi:hypothetical protein
LRPLVPKYEEIGKAFVGLAARYRDKELQLICDYMESAAEVTRQELAKLVVGNSSR